MMLKIHQLIAVVGWPQLAVIGLLFVLWALEQILPQTKLVKANSITQAAFNALWAWAKLRYPLVARLGNLADQVVLQVQQTTQQTTTTETTTATVTAPATPDARTKQ